MKQVLVLAGGSTNHFVHNFNNVIEKALRLPVKTINETNFLRLFLYLSCNTKVIFIHWPDSIFWGSSNKCIFLVKGILILLFLIIQVILRTKIIWVVNNITPHDTNKSNYKFSSFYLNLVARCVDGWLTLSPSTHDLVIQKFPILKNKPYSFIWHPPYPAIQKTKRIREGSVVFGYAGHLKESKNFLSAIKAFQNLRNEETELLLSGSISSKYKTILLDQIQGQENIKLLCGFIPDDDYGNLMSSFDIVVVPYNHYLHSGVIVHALSYNKIIVCKKTNFSMDLAVYAPENFVLYDKNISEDILNEAIMKLRQFPLGVVCIDFLSNNKNIDRLTNLLKYLGL